MTKATKNSVASIDDEDFTVADRDEIVRLLSGLARNKVTLSAVFNSGKDILLTAVLEVDAAQDTILLDTSANSMSNEQLLHSQRTIFHSFSEGVKIQWVSSSIGSASYEGNKAFRITIPEKMQRIQRRGFYRVNTPIINPLLCQVTLAPDRVVDLVLVDICAEGIGVILPGDTVLERGAQFADCKLHLPEIGTVEVALFVRSTWEVVLKNGSKSPRAGLEFAAIRPATQARIQRYINKLERSRIAAAAGR